MAISGSLVLGRARRHLCLDPRHQVDHGAEGLAGAVAAPSPPPIERHWPSFGPAMQLARIFQNPAQMKRVGSGVARVRKKARAIPPDKKVTTDCTDLSKAQHLAREWMKKHGK